MPRRGGAAPKSPDQMTNSTRAKAEKARIRSVESEPCEAPELPEFTPRGEEWPEHTKVWWEHWIEDPLTNDYRMADWLDLIDCAAIHARLWSGDYKAAAELRLRMARHGATREDRARLRIVFTTADEMERKAAQRASGAPEGASREQPARKRRGGFTAIQGGGA